ncbi:hypothetical protein Celaphus_00008941, partial [Cervus elaphus hippelaphus]
MNGQYLYNFPITVEGHKKDSKEPLSQADHPHQLFADAPPPPSAPNLVVSSLGSGLPPPRVPPSGSVPPPVPPPGAFHLGYPQLCPHHLCLLELEDMASHQREPQGLDNLDTDTYILTHSHWRCLRCSWPTIALMAWDSPMLGPLALGGQPPPQPPPGMPHSEHLPISMPHPCQGPLFGSTVGLPDPMPPRGMHGPPLLMPPHGWIHWPSMTFTLWLPVGAVPSTQTHSLASSSPSRPTLRPSPS